MNDSAPGPHTPGPNDAAASRSDSAGPNDAAASRSDSAGTPWAGRTVPDPGFAGDDGSADADLEAALTAWSAAQPAQRPQGSDRMGGQVVEPDDGEARLQEDVVAALAAARLLVPVVAVLGETAETEGQSGSGLSADKSADMALVTLQAPDGGSAVPVFTSLERLAAWRPEARPVPAEAQRVALAAVSDGATWLVVDPAGPVTFAVARSPLWALAQGRPWRQPHRDDKVVAAVTAAVREVPEVAGLSLSTFGSAQLAVTVALPPGLDQAKVQTLAQQVGDRLGALDVVRERVDGVALRFVPA